VLCGETAYADAMAKKTRPARALIDDLRELVEAIDRRVPHLERDGETQIARDAAELRALALARIAALEQEA
jgi:hypothetical protein